MPDNRKRTEAEDLDPESDRFVDEDDYSIDCDGLDDMEFTAEGRSLRSRTSD
jgi:hypothetical protein